MSLRRSIPSWLRAMADVRYDPPTLQAAWEAVAAGDPGGAAALEVAARPLVARVVRGYCRHGLGLLDAEDLMQAGFFGLRRAAEKYDPAAPRRRPGAGGDGATFATYATYWVRASVQKAYVRDNWAQIRRPALPVPGRARPRFDRIASDGDAGAAEPAARWCREDDPVQAAIDREQHARVLAAIAAALLPGHARVILLRYGFDDGVCRTFDEIAAVLAAEGRPVTRQRVQQLERVALRQLALSLGVRFTRPASYRVALVGYGRRPRPRPEVAQ